MTITAARGYLMTVQTDYPLAGTRYRYTMHVERPLFARGNLYSVFVTLTALVHPLNAVAQIPSLDAWGRHESDARENLEGEIRTWLVHREERAC